MPASERADQIQQMLITRLEKKIKSLEEKALRLDRKVESLNKEKEDLHVRLRELASESAARVYILEESRDDVQRRLRQLEEQVELERSLAARKDAKRQNRREDDDS